jgi:DNA modification methylase
VDVLFGPGDAPKIARLRAAAIYAKPASGKTHSFYRYPARFSPEFAEAVISELTLPGDWVLDPFAGGGTSVIEGVALGRKVVGVDINALAHFVTRVSTTPLSAQDCQVISSWAEKVSAEPATWIHYGLDEREIQNFPPGLRRLILGAISCADSDMSLPRRRDFARCALLRLGQWALESASPHPRIAYAAGNRLPAMVQSMVQGLNELVERCALSGIRKSWITGRRLLLNRSSIGLDTESRLRCLQGRIRLVITSPPYPGVHVLYHRWQYKGRRETNAPYWIANLNDGQGESYYTFGDRKTATGINSYFDKLYLSFRSIRPYLSDNGLVVQLISFADPAAQFPRFLSAMERAGYEEVQLSWNLGTRLWRRVPNRRWYTQISRRSNAGNEVLLIHRTKS